MCDARNEQSVARLRTLKRRARKPLAVMMGSLAEAKLHVTGSEDEWKLLTSQARPITLLRKRINDDRLSESLLTTALLAEGIAPASPTSASCSPIPRSISCCWMPAPCRWWPPAPMVAAALS